MEVRKQSSLLCLSETALRFLGSKTVAFSERMSASRLATAIRSIKVSQNDKTDAEDFFFLHNGITAICSQMSIHDGVLSVKELNVVNGCQSLSTIFSSSEAAKKATDAYILFRFMKLKTKTELTG